MWGIFSSLFSLRSSWLATKSERDHPPKKRKQAQICLDQTPVTNCCRLFFFLKECGSGWQWPGLVLAMLNVLREGDKRAYPRSASCRAALKRSSKGILCVLKQLFHPPHSHPMPCTTTADQKCWAESFGLPLSFFSFKALASCLASEKGVWEKERDERSVFKTSARVSSSSSIRRFSVCCFRHCLQR